MPNVCFKILAIMLAGAPLACTSPKDPSPPTIHVNQRGLMERMAQTPQSPKQPAPEDESKETAEQIPEEQSLTGVVRKDPKPSDSGERVFFRRVDTEEVQDQANTPAVDFSSVRDPRTEEFLGRERARARKPLQ